MRPVSTGLNRFEVTTGQNRFFEETEPTRTGLVGSVAVAPKVSNRNRGCGCRLPILGLKNRTELDPQTLLNRVGITLSYTQAIGKLKQLSVERLKDTRKVAKTKAFMLIWDNLNITFKVSEQRHDSTDHFDNGTTATLVPLYGVEHGELPLKLKRTHRRPILKFGPDDLLPSHEEAHRVQAGQLWHIKYILYDVFPALRKQLRLSISPFPTVQQIPVHKTEQYPLPAMHINESSLEGTLSVMNTIFRSTLELSEDDVRKHGLVICAGDQFSLALLDKASSLFIHSSISSSSLQDFSHST